MHGLLPPPNDDDDGDYDVVDGGVQELCSGVVSGGAMMRLICEGCTCV